MFNLNHHRARLPTPIPGNAANTALVAQLGRGYQESVTVLLIDNHPMSVVLAHSRPALVPHYLGTGSTGDNAGKANLPTQLTCLQL